MINKKYILGISPILFFIGIFMVIPMFIMLAYSFMESNSYGGVYANFTTAAYQQLLFETDLAGNYVFNPSTIQIIGYSVSLAAIATISSLVLGFPVAYYIVNVHDEQKRNILLFLITLPFWTNALVRTFAWTIIFSNNGTLELPFRYFGLIDEGFGLLFTKFAITVGNLYTFIPLMVLPIYASLEKMDWRLCEAGSDLYATKLNVFIKIIIPLAMPGIVGGCILVFIPSLGSFLAPDLLGGGKNLLLGSLVQNQFSIARNWAFGSAIAMILLAITILALYYQAVYNKRVSKMMGEA